MNWYRIELSEEGKLLGCALITSARVASRLIYFVSAPSEEEAIEKLLARRKKRLETRGRQDKAFRDQCAVSGLCTACGKVPPPPGYARCVDCRAYAAEHMRKQRAGLIERPHPRTRDEEIASEARQETNRKARHADWKAKQRQYDEKRRAKTARRLADLGGSGTLRTWRARAALTLQMLDLFDSMSPTEFRSRLVQLTVDCHAKGDMPPPPFAGLAERGTKVASVTVLEPRRFGAGRKKAGEQ